MSRARPVLLMVRALSIGGCERDLTKMALALDRSKYQPYVACFRPEGPRYAELTAAGVPVLHIPVTSFRSWSAVRGAWVLRRHIRNHGILVLHAFDVPSDIFAAPIAWLLRVPAVITCQLSYRHMYQPWERKMLRITDRLADCIVVNSEAVKRDLMETEGIEENRIVVSHNGVDGASFHALPGNERRRKPCVAGASIVVGTVCALRQEKRLDVLLRAFAGVRTLRRGMKLLLVGSGPMQSEIEALRKQLGLEDDCVMAPAQDEVASWMWSMDIFVVSSDSESFPNALLEAMACGCCAIGSEVGGIPEMITDGSNGVLVRAGDCEALGQALTRVVTDDGLRQRLAEAAQATSHSRFSMDAAARRTEALYDALLDASEANGGRGATPEERAGGRV
jgi:glycosyltransferase involved in cell wall biosynthesis